MSTFLICLLFYFILGWGGGGFQWLLESGGKNMG